MTERYLITINSIGNEDKIKVLVLDQQKMKIRHESVYARDLLDVIKAMFLDYYGHREVKFVETINESIPHSLPSN